MPDPRISEDTILLVARLINEAEDMKNAANDALKDTWADHRETLKSLGLSGKEISAEVAQFKAAIAENRLTATEADKRDQKAEGKDEYLAILTSPRARARKGQSNTAPNTSNSGPDDVEDEPEVTIPQTRVAALRADPAMAIVEAANITPKSQPTKAAGQASLGQALPSSVENEVAEISTPITEPQPSQPAGSDLTSLAPHEGQVAPNPVAKADDDVNAGGVDSPSVSSDARPGKTAEAESVSRVDGGRTPSATSEHMDVTAGETAPKYAEKGVVTWESTPPEGVERHPYSNAFGTLGQDAVVIADDIAMAKAAPIVKIGNVILDGWARYMTARGSVGLTGQSTEYSVVQYDGHDPLIDCIRWNIAGRILSDKDKQTVVARLSAIEPKRKADILKAVAELAI